MIAGTFLLCIEEEGWMETICCRKQVRKLAYGFAQRRSETHLLGESMPVRAVLLPDGGIGEETPDESCENWLRFIASTLAPVAKLLALDALPELLAGFEHGSQSLVRYEVVPAPDLALVLAVKLVERLENVEEHHVIARAMNKLAACCCCLVTSRCRVGEKLIGGVDERDEVDDFSWTAFCEGSHENAGVNGVERKCGHLPAERSYAALPIDSFETSKGEQSEDDCRTGYRQPELEERSVRHDALDSLSGRSI